MSDYGRSGYSDPYWGEQPPQDPNYGFDMSGSNFGQELNFQSFDGQQPSEGSQYSGAPLYDSNPYLDPAGGSGGYRGAIFTPQAGPGLHQGTGGWRRGLRRRATPPGRTWHQSRPHHTKDAVLLFLQKLLL
ncbi:uncharacterized protein LOC134541382 [Bacillus rossius redtenbacheri]|uniref:uncharacterized protein LOC134541382 n=1 Tax=Bacillus rossius redtenbacheri TaxID=93214 RepID=UPI002FDEA292